MVKQKKNAGYWKIKENCLKEAKKHKSKATFKKAYSRAYHTCRENDWLEEACAHMISTKKPNGYWKVKENCISEAKKYKRRVDFIKNAGAAYTNCLENGWLDDACKHMKYINQKNGFWTKERCLKEARRFKTRSEYQIKSGSSYAASKREGWLDEVCSHMKVQGNRFKRAIYIYEFKDMSVYVGLTFNYRKRYNDHHSKMNSPVFKKINQGFTYRYYEQGEWLDLEEIQKEEHRWINWYDKKGWKVLNKAKAGGLGGTNIKWSKKLALTEAKKYKSKTEFMRKSAGAYDFCRKSNLLSKACGHMDEKIKPNGYWTDNRLFKEAKKYNTRGELQKKCGTAYSYLRKRNLLDKACMHMEKHNIGHGYWQKKENCWKEALKHNYRADFKNAFPAAYSSSCKNGWLSEICSHMVAKPRVRIWTKEKCRSTAKKFKSRGSFQKAYKGAYNAAYKNKWLDEICQHMK